MPVILFARIQENSSNFETCYPEAMTSDNSKFMVQKTTKRVPEK